MDNRHTALTRWHYTMSARFHWTCRFDDRGLTVFAQACSGQSVDHLDSCRLCQQLVKNSSLEGILTRMKEGVHANSPHAYYGFSGLQEIIQRKDSAKGSPDRILPLSLIEPS